MRISIDANNDTLTIDDTAIRLDNNPPLATWAVKQPHRHWEILTEILNRLDIAGVTLEYIDEDTVKTEEW